MSSDNGGNRFSKSPRGSPATGIVHQVNLNIFRQVVFRNKEQQRLLSRQCVALTSLTPMVNAWRAGVGSVALRLKP